MKSTQIYLSEAEHAALQRAAADAGVSMTAVIRDLIEKHLLANEAPPTDLTPLIGAAGPGRPTDVATQKQQMLDEALYADFRRHERPLRVAESK
jgi:Ribbon-helix-helix protein, copG family